MRCVGWLNSNEIPPPPVILFSHWDFFQSLSSDLVWFRDGSVRFVFSCIRDFCVDLAQGSARKREVWWTGIPVISSQSESREGSVAWSASATGRLSTSWSQPYPAMHGLILRVNLQICIWRYEILWALFKWAPQSLTSSSASPKC